MYSNAKMPTVQNGLGENGMDPTVITEYQPEPPSANTITGLESALETSNLDSDALEDLTYLLDQSNLTTTQIQNLRRQPPPVVPGLMDTRTYHIPYYYPETIMPYLAWQLVYGALTFPQAIMTLFVDLHLDSIRQIQSRLQNWVVGTAHTRSALAQEALLARVSETVDGTSGFTLEEIFGVVVQELYGLELSHPPLDILEEPDPDRRTYRQRSPHKPRDRDRDHSRSPGAEGKMVLTFRPHN
jgi:hypothetical protein